MTPIDPNSITHTQHIAAATGRSPSQVTKWLRIGILPFHVLPTARTSALSGAQRSVKRRVVVRDLIAFCKGRNIPLDLGKLKVQRANRNSSANFRARTMVRQQPTAGAEGRGSDGSA